MAMWLQKGIIKDTKSDLDPTASKDRKSKAGIDKAMQARLEKKAKKDLPTAMKLLSLVDKAPGSVIAPDLNPVVSYKRFRLQINWTEQ